MSLGKSILRARQEQSLTQTQLANRAGLSAAYVSRLENERIHPTMSTVARVAGALDLSLAELFGNAEPPTASHLARCPVSQTGDCIGELIRSGRGRKPRSDRPLYGVDELRLLRLTDIVARHGSAAERAALRILLEALVDSSHRR